MGCFISGDESVKLPVDFQRLGIGFKARIVGLKCRRFLASPTYPMEFPWFFMLKDRFKNRSIYIGRNPWNSLGLNVEHDSCATFQGEPIFEVAVWTEPGPFINVWVINRAKSNDNFSDNPKTHHPIIQSNWFPQLVSPVGFPSSSSTEGFLDAPNRPRRSQRSMAPPPVESEGRAEHCASFDG